MCTTRGERKLIKRMCGKQIGNSLRNDAILDQNIPCCLRVMRIFITEGLDGGLVFTIN